MKRLLVLTVLIAVTASCYSWRPQPAEEPDYGRELPPGASALRKVGPGERIPDPKLAFAARDEGLVQALDRSLLWFEAPSSRRFFPFEDICTHEQARASVAAFREILTESRDEAEFMRRFTALFDCYQSVGYDGRGVVLYTGYYAPEFPASRTRTTRFTHPLYRRPADLATDPVTGRPLGRQRPDGSFEPYPTRREIEEGRLLEGTELVWLEDELAAYIVQVNGSAKLKLPDGSILFVGYDGKTDRDYVGLGTRLVEEGIIPQSRLSLPAVVAAYRADPARVRELMYENECYVFFSEYDGRTWPAGSLGVPVTARRSLATDKRIYPRGGVVMVSTRSVSLTSGKRDFLQFMVDQDTGGAIRAPGRADIFMGIGPRAEVLAGGQYAEGSLYYFFLKPRYVDRYGDTKAAKLNGSRY